VTVPEVVEVHAGHDRWSVLVGLAAGGRCPGAPVEVGTALVSAAGAAEHARMGMRACDLLEQVDEESG